MVHPARPLQLAAAVVLLAGCGTSTGRSASSPPPADTVTDAPTRPAAATATPKPKGEAYIAGDYEFTGVEVGSGITGNVDMRAYVTNHGDDATKLVVAANLLSRGAPVATARTTTSDLAAGETVLLHFISADSFHDWDDIEFQIVSES